MSNVSYTSTAKALHWIMAFSIVGLFFFGFYMSNLPLSPEKLKFYSWHKWAGVSVFFFAIIRLFWRTYKRSPDLPKHMQRNARLAAHSGHALLYFLMFSIPLSGWLMSSAKGFQTVVFGVLPIPDFLTKNFELGNILQKIHWSLNMALAAIVLGHVAAALKHHVIDKDDILTRMLPYGSKK